MKINMLAFFVISAIITSCNTEGDNSSKKDENILKEEGRPIHTLSWGLGPPVTVGFAGHTYEYFLNGESLGVGNEGLAKAFDFIISSEPCVVKFLCRNHQFPDHAPFDESQTIKSMRWHFWDKDISMLLVYERSDKAIVGRPDGNPFKKGLVSDSSD